MGSKSKIAKYILPIMLKNRKPNQYFVEPFVGGCNITDKVTGNRLASDNNPYLIAMWKGLQIEHKRIITIPKDIYDFHRNLFRNKSIIDFDTIFDIGWIGFMASYNGRFYDGGYSGHNVNGRNYIAEQIRNTESQMPKIQDVHFVCTDYSNLIIPDNSIIYCDIPYKNTKQYIYSLGFDYNKFWNWAEKKIAEGHLVFVSEYTAPKNFIPVWQKSVTNSLNTFKTYQPVEKLFVHQSIYKIITG